MALDRFRIIARDSRRSNEASLFFINSPTRPINRSPFGRRNQILTRLADKGVYCCAFRVDGRPYICLRTVRDFSNLWSFIIGPLHLTRVPSFVTGSNSTPYSRARAASITSKVRSLSVFQ